jgi:tetratricopeptide (TPR) repeat protein
MTDRARENLTANPVFMTPVSIATARHLRQAVGYLSLGMLNEASAELEAIEGEDRLSVEVMAVRADLYMEAKQWDLLIAVTRELNRQRPCFGKGWIFRAFALRELNRVAEAKAVLLEAEPMHGEKCEVLHYNLACYHCLLGKLPEARERLRKACRMDKQWKEAALDDPDLKAIWGDVEAMK